MWAVILQHIISGAKVNATLTLKGFIIKNVRKRIWLNLEWSEIGNGFPTWSECLQEGTSNCQNTVKGCVKENLPGVPEAQGLARLPTCLVGDLILNQVLTDLSGGKRPGVAEASFQTSVFSLFFPPSFVCLFYFFKGWNTKQLYLFSSFWIHS